MRLSTRLTLAMVALVLFTSAAIGVLVYRNVEAIALPRALERMDLHTRLLAKVLDVTVRGARTDVTTQGRGIDGLVNATLAGSAQLPDQTPADVWRERLASRFVAQLKAEADYAQFRLIGLADGGREIVRVDRAGPGGAIRVVPDAELRSLAGRDFFKAAVELPPSEIHVAQIDLMRDDGRIVMPPVPILRVSAPVYGPDRKPFGVMSVDYDLRAAFRPIREDSRYGGNVYIVNEDGDYLMHPDPAREFGYAFGTPYRVQDDFPGITEVLARSPAASHLIRGKADERFGIGWETIRLAGGPRISVIQMMPYALLLAAISGVRDASLGVGLAALLVALAFAVVIARSLTRPLVQMTKAVESFGGGAPMPVPSDAKDEIGVLAGAFARMVEETRGKTEALKREIEERRRVFENSVDLILVVDRQGTFIQASPSSRAILGYSPDEMIGRSAVDFVFPDDLDAVRNEMRLARRSGEQRSFEARYIRKDGRVVTIGWTGVWSEPVKQHFFIGRDMTERIKAEEALKYLAHYDQLTGLPNRTTLHADLGEMLTRHDAPSPHPTSIAMLDLDGFKDINDTLGHSIGDRLLKEAAARLTAAVGGRARVYRLGGDEFVAVFPDLGDPRTVAESVDAMLKRMAESFEIGGQRIYIGASAGIAIAPADGSDIEELIANADLALYDAKASGGQRYRLFLPVLRAKAQARRELESELRRAIANSEFELYFQPQLRLSDGAVAGAEALLRWRHPVRGILAPGAFIDALAESQVVLEAGRWILRQACEKAAAWRASGYPLRIGVNLFRAQFRDGTLVDDVERALRESGLPPEALELEITENTALGTDEALIGPLRTLRDKGIKFALDDFGTGYASLSYLTRYPLSRLKIDRSFVQKITDDSKDTAILRSIIVMAHNLGLEVIAEGVEVPEQAAFLNEQGCDEVQGYLYAKPLPVAEFEAFLALKKIESRGHAGARVTIDPTRRRAG